MFQKLGVMRDYFANRDNPSEADLGRYAITGDAGDLHDGSARTLNDAVDVMFKYQLGRVASKGDKVAIIGFLKTLTGELPDAP